MRLDHIAYRVSDRNKTSKFLSEAFGYKIEDDFEIDFGDGKFARCYAMIPPEKTIKTLPFNHSIITPLAEYHRPAEIFVSEGTDGSIVDKWVKERGGIGGIHHIAYQVESVQEVMDDWKNKNLASFTTEAPITSEDLIQCFTNPHPLTGVIYEFIERKNKGFNISNVKKLMESTED